MKKYLLSLSLLLLLLITACSSAAQANIDTPNTTATPTGASAPSNMQLALGLFALEETDNAISAEQAAELLPLWKAAKSLSESSTITTEEFQAVFKQIQEALTPEQLTTITTMELSPETMAELGEKYGFTFGPGNGFDPSTLTVEQQATREAFRQSAQQSGGQAPGDGGFPGGGPGGGVPPDGGGFPGGAGGGFPGGGGDISSLPSAQQTAIASGAGRGGNNGGLPAAFYEAVIQFLQAKVIPQPG